MKSPEFKFKSRLWLWSGSSAWHFVTLPKKLSYKIDNLFNDQKRGWGSLPVSVFVGKSEWETSIFPDKNAKAFILPIKKSIRKEENLSKNDLVNFSIRIII